MLLATPIKTIIAANAPAFAVVAGRVYSGRLLQGSTLPAVVVQSAGTTPYDTKSGASTVDAIRMQVDVYADTLTAADAAAELIRTAIDRYRGDVTANALTWSIDGIRFLDAREMFDDKPDHFRVMAEYQVRLQRSAATGVTGSTGLQFYANDTEAKAAGLEVGQHYLLAANNDYGAKHGTVVQITES
jgi:hypothetical protein